MQRIRLKQVDEISRKKIPDAYNSFMRQCKLKNLSPYSYLYYEKNIGFFLESLPDSKYVDEITPEIIENFISMLMDRGNRVTAINARLRGVYVFLRYCFDQKYMEGFPLMLIKEDESFKEPYESWIGSDFRTAEMTSTRNNRSGDRLSYIGGRSHFPLPPLFCKEL